MIDKKFIPVGGLKREPYSGCHGGMRYYFQADEDKTTFSAFVYPEPWSFEKTPEEDKQRSSFPLTDEGMDQAIEWLHAMYDSQKEKWQNSAKECMHLVNQK